MRFLVSEHDYEAPLAGGMYRFSLNDRLLGVTEAWRVTSAPDDYNIFRVDVDARPSLGLSLLLHMVVDGEGQPERVVYRSLQENGETVSGNLLFEDGVIIHRQIVGTETRTEERPQTPFILPPFLFGLGMLARAVPRLPATVTTLNDALQLEAMSLSYVRQRTRNLIPVTIGRNHFSTTRLAITTNETTHTLWRDKLGYPVKMERSDGIMAEDVRPMRYNTSAGGKLNKKK